MKVAVIYNYNLHYREPIFKKLDDEYDVDFYFGDKMPDAIKGFNILNLRGHVMVLKNIIINKRIVWRKGVLSVGLKNYDKYLILGEFHNISLWLLVILLKIRRKDVYNWTHGWYGKEGQLVVFLKKIYFLLYSGIFVYGEYAKRLMIKNGVKQEKIKVIYNSLDYACQKKIREKMCESGIYEMHFGNNYNVVVFSGRLTKVKSISLLINAHRYMVDYYGEDFNVVLIGDGDEKENLIAEVNDKSLNDRYWFFGATYDEKVIAELYYNASLCVSPGNVGLTAMHAMVYGCPVITHSDYAFQMPEYEVIENGKTGMFFERDNIRDLADSISWWLKYSFGKRDVIRKDCYKRIDDYYNPSYQMKVFKQVFG